jgi:mannose-6-phosphate isomerase-like protein (cupin superfamily)
LKYLIGFTAFLATAMAFAAGEAAVYVDHDTAAAALKKGGSFAKGSDYAASGAHRAKAGQVEVHEKETDIIYITDGEATFVTGGTMVGGKMSKTGQWLGTDIQGGESHHLTKGDVVVVPAGIPHWFKEVPSGVDYLLVKVVKP